MPTYEYRCPDCAHQYEKREGFDAPAAQKCPQCSSIAQRVIHAPPIVFKGSGFYVTDSRKPDSDASAEKSAPSTDGATPTKDAAPAKKSDRGSGKDVEQAAAT